MHWLEVVTIIGSLGGFMFYWLNRIDSDMKANHADIAAANQRIDKLYQMFVDLLKEGRK